MRDDENPPVGLLVSKTFQRQPDKVIAVPGDKTAALKNGPVNLILILKTTSAAFMSADRIDSFPAKDFGYARAQVLVKVEFHRALPLEAEARGINAGYRFRR